jgi:DNA-binding HxlR family transcriptional regulator
LKPDIISPSVRILRAIGLYDRTMMAIAMHIWPNGGQSVLQGAILASEVRRMVADGLVERRPATPLFGSKCSRFSYRLTPKGQNLLFVDDASAILDAIEAETQPEGRVTLEPDALETPWRP